MDLQAMLNTDGGGAGGGRTNTTQPGRPLQPTPSSLAPNTPSTPGQTGPPPPRRNPPNHSPSPVFPPLEYPPPGIQIPKPPSAGPGPAPYGSPTGYHLSPGGPYAGRPSVPPLQPLAPQEIRSPGGTSFSAQSPFRQTPTSSASVGSAGYPFPPTQQQPPASPGQRQPYYPRESYPNQHSLPPQGPAAYQQSQHQQQQQQSIPQTPPVGTPGGSHQYLQQRSLSIHSTPTPTSAQSQHAPYLPSYAQGSPIASHHAPAPNEQHLRHQSPQPAHHPLGPPPTTHHRHSPAMSYQPPPSPYQQRMPSASGPYPQMLKSSPPPPPPASITRMPSGGHSAYDVASASQRRSQSQQSQGERERSISVSPKTRVPSLPSSTGQPAPAEQNYYAQSRLPPQQPPTGSVAANMDSQRDVHPAKRKIDDRDLRPEEVENQRPPPPPPNKANGNGNGNNGTHPQRFSATPTMPPAKKRIKLDSPPIWVQSGRKHPLAASRNFSIKQQHAAGPSNPASIANGVHHEPGPPGKAERPSRHTSPETARLSTAGRDEQPSHGTAKEPLTFGGQEFPWEPSIEGPKPLDLISRSAADFFVFNVLQGPKLDELSARGASFEIEAKLGMIIDRSTNERIDVMVQAGECIIGEGSRIAFRSSMSESQHRALNGYLNEQVTSQRNPRVPIKYAHRRETDRFFELPNQLRHRVPPSFAHLLHPNAPLKARVSYDQKTGQHLASIVKARVADLHIHMAHLPLDCRISVNIEWNWDGPPQEIEQNQIPNKDRQPDRSKDRLSYKHGFYQIDLTQVTQATIGPQGQPGPASKEHELEIELQGDVLYRHGMLLMNREPNRYADLVDGLIDNVRVLARRCPPH